MFLAFANKGSMETLQQLRYFFFFVRKIFRNPRKFLEDSKKKRYDYDFQTIMKFHFDVKGKKKLKLMFGFILQTM